MSSQDNNWCGEIKKGDIVVIIGDAGSGKSTLLKEILSKTPMKPCYVHDIKTILLALPAKQNDDVVLVLPELNELSGMDNRIAFFKDIQSTKNTVILVCSKLFAENWLNHVATVCLVLGKNYVVDVTYKIKSVYKAKAPSLE